MYIITHLYAIKDSWNFDIMKWFLNIFWIFEVLEFHIFKNMIVTLPLSVLLHFWNPNYFVSGQKVFLFDNKIHRMK
jgi:hypothetical protein